MAVRTVSDTGGNWSATTAWVGGVVPVSGDSVVFTSTSGNLNVNSTTANLVGIDFTNYLGTITFNGFNINTSGTVNLGSGGYIQSGSTGLNINGTTTLISNGVTWSRTLSFSGASIVYTLSDDWNVAGNISFNGSTSSTLNGNTLNIGAGLTTTTTAIVSGNTSFVLNGTGTWSNSSTGAIRNNLTINTTGTTTISGNIYYNTGILSHSAGTVITTGSTLNISLGTTLNTSGITWNNFTSAGSTYTLNLNSDLNITGTTTLNHTGTLSFSSGTNLFNPTGPLTLSQGTTTLPNNLNITNLNSTGTSIINNNTTNVSGNLTINGGISGSTNILINGTSNQTWSSSSYIANNLTIDKSTGNFNISGTIYYSSGLLKHNNGNVITTGSTLTLYIPTNANSSVTLDTSGITWNNLGFDYVTQGRTITVNLNSDLNVLGDVLIGSSTRAIFSIVFTGVGVLKPSVTSDLRTVSTDYTSASLTLNSGITVNNLTFFGGPTTNNLLTINGANINILGSLTFTGSAGKRLIGDGSLTMIGSGSLSTGTPFQLASTYYNVLGIDLIFNTSGTINVGSSFGFFSQNANVNTLTYSAGTVNSSSTNLYLVGANINCVLNTSGLTWNNAYIYRGTNTGSDSITLTSDLNLLGSLNFNNAPISDNTAACVINGSGRNINLGGIFINHQANVNISGTARFVFKNTGTWSQTTAVSISNPILFNTTGTTTISGTVYYGSGTMTYSGGSVITTGSSINFNSSTLSNLSAVTLNNVLMSGNITINSDINIGGNLTTQTTAVVINNPSYNVYVGGNLTINVSTSGGSPIIINGNNNQSWNGSSFLNNSLNIDKSGGTLTVGTVYYATGTLRWVNGTVSALSSSMFLQTCTLNTGIVVWGAVYTNQYTNSSFYTYTLTGNFNVTTLVTYYPTSFISSGGLLSVNGGDLYLGNHNYPSTGFVTLNLCNNIIVRDINFYNNTYGNNSNQGTILNNYNLTVTRDINMFMNPSAFGTTPQGNHYGTTNIVWTVPSGNTGTYKNTLNGNLYTAYPQILNHNLTINGLGTAQISGVTYQTGNFTISGNFTMPSGSNYVYNGGSITHNGGTVINSGSTLTVNGGSTLNVSGITWPNVTVNTSTNALGQNFNAGNLSIAGTTTFNGSPYNINVSGNFTMNATTSGSANFILNGSDNQSWTSGPFYLSNNLTIIKPSGVLTTSANIYYQTGSLIYSGGTVNTSTNSTSLIVGSSCNLGTNPIVWNNLTTSFTGTINLLSNLTWSNLWSVTTGAPVFSGNSSFLPLPTSRISLTGNANVTIPGSITGYTFSAITITSSLATTLTGNLGCNGLLTLGGIINSSAGGAKTLNAFGDLQITNTTSGSANILITGSTQQSWSSSAYLSNNLTINKTSGTTLTIGPNVYYNTGSLVYTSGIVDTTTNLSTLNINSTCTLATNGIEWYNFATTLSGNINLTNNLTWSNLWSVTAGSPVFVGSGSFTPKPTSRINFAGTANVTTPGTITGYTFSSITITSTNATTLTGDLICGGLLTLSLFGQGGQTTINGVGRRIITNGGMTIPTTTGNVTGTATIKVTGGNINSSGSLSGGLVQLNVEIDGDVVFTSGNTFYFYGGPTGTASFNYISGNITTIGSTVWFNSCVLNSGNIPWNNVRFLAGSPTPTTLNSDVIVNGLLTLGYETASMVISSIGSSKTIIANNGLLMSGVNGSVSGSANIKVTKGNIVGTGTVTLKNNLELFGDITFPQNVSFYYDTGELKYSGGRINTRRSILRLTAATRLTNIHKMVWENVVISSGVNITMNEFFCGSPTLTSQINPSSTSNYTITFSDSTEKFAKFVKVSRATTSRNNQLTILTRNSNGGNNIGINFYPNQKPNGWAKNNPSITDAQINGFGGILSDPIFK